MNLSNNAIYERVVSGLFLEVPQEELSQGFEYLNQDNLNDSNQQEVIDPHSINELIEQHC